MRRPLRLYDRCRWNVARIMITMLLAAIVAAFAVGCASGVPSSSRRLSPISSCVESITGESHGAPRPLMTSLPRDIVARYGIFRRHSLPSDVPQGGAKRLVRELADYFEVGSYYAAYIRRLGGSTSDSAYFVVPGFARVGSLYPTVCGSRIERRRRAEERRHRITEPIYCIVEMRRQKKVRPLGCEPFAAVPHGVALFESNGVTRKLQVLLAPDGVVGQRLHYREVPGMLIQVSDNAFSFTPAPPSAQVSSELAQLAPELGESNLSRQQRAQVTRKWDAVVAKTHPTKIEWVGSAGEVLKTMMPPSSEALSAISLGDLRVPISG